MNSTIRSLVVSVERNDYKSFKKLSMKVKREDIISFREDGGWSLLHILADSFKGKDTKIFLELSQVIDPNVKNQFGSTPLYIASQNGHSDVVRMLLENPSQNGHSDVVRMLLENHKCTPLYIASQNGHSDVLHFSLHHRKDIQM
eukprot:TRINITY_DN4299_c0_g1_i8.p1 TRINITY_DN4299_c0_g1~~TRINITY_DN4299_c0_g1_i8.p1  ORF type:complete len:144 (-),score=41.10 TRINITY_DN4299_c0_g1_i8:156-587(-)